MDMETAGSATTEEAADHTVEVYTLFDVAIHNRPVPLGSVIGAAAFIAAKAICQMHESARAFALDMMTEIASNAVADNPWKESDECQTQGFSIRECRR